MSVLWEPRPPRRGAFARITGTVRDNRITGTVTGSVPPRGPTEREKRACVFCGLLGALALAGVILVYVVLVEWLT